MFQLRKTVGFVTWMLLVMAKLKEILNKVRRESTWFVQTTNCIFLPLDKPHFERKRKSGEGLALNRTILWPGVTW